MGRRGGLVEAGSGGADGTAGATVDGRGGGKRDGTLGALGGDGVGALGRGGGGGLPGGAGGTGGALVVVGGFGAAPLTGIDGGFANDGGLAGAAHCLSRK